MKRYSKPTIIVRNTRNMSIIVTSTTGSGNDFLGDDSWNNPNTSSSRVSTRTEYESTNN